MKLCNSVVVAILCFCCLLFFVDGQFSGVVRTNHLNNQAIRFQPYPAQRPVQLPSPQQFNLNVHHELQNLQNRHQNPLPIRPINVQAVVPQGMRMNHGFDPNVVNQPFSAPALTPGNHIHSFPHTHNLFFNLSNIFISESNTVRSIIPILSTRLI